MIEALRGPAYSPDGKLYRWGLCKGSYDDGTLPTVSNYLLWDVYKQAGYPRLENFNDDMVNVLEAMVKAYPVNAEGKKTYGVGGWFGDGQGWGEWLIYYLNLWPEAIHHDDNHQILAINTVDSTAINKNSFTDPTSYYWQAVEFYNKAYQRGLFDTDSFTQNVDAYVAKLNEGRYMLTTAGWQASGANDEFKKTSGNTHEFVSLPSLNGKAEARFNTLPFGERHYGVLAKTKYPERCVALLDYISTYEFSRLVFNGVEGINWSMVNGKPTPKPEYLSADRGNKDWRIRTGANIYGHFMGYGNGTIDPATGVAIDLYQYSQEANEKKMTPTLRDFISHYGQNTLLEVYESKAQVLTALDMIALGAYPDNLQGYINGLNAYIAKNFTKVIVARNDAEFVRLRDEMIAGMTDFHVDEIFRVVYNEAAGQGDQIAKLVRMLEQ
jgi:hypothetical protein